MKRETEDLLIESQNNAIKTKYGKATIDDTENNRKSDV